MSYIYVTALLAGSCIVALCIGLVLLARRIFGLFKFKLEGLRWAKFELLGLCSSKFNMFSILTDSMINNFPLLRIAANIPQQTPSSNQDAVEGNEDETTFLARLVRLCDWLVLVKKFELQLDWHLVRFHIKINLIQMYVNPQIISSTRSPSPPQCNKSTMTQSQFQVLEELIRKKFRIIMFIYQLISRFICVEVNQINVIFTHIPNVPTTEKLSQLDSIVIAGIDILRLQIFYDDPLTEDSHTSHNQHAQNAQSHYSHIPSTIEGRAAGRSHRLRQVPALQWTGLYCYEATVDKQTFAMCNRRRIAKIEDVCLTISNYRKTFLIDLDIPTDIEVDLWVTFILLFVTFGYHNKNSSNEGNEMDSQKKTEHETEEKHKRQELPQNDKEPKLEFFNPMLLLPINLAVSLNLTKIRVSAHLPYHDASQQRFEEAKLVLEEVKGHLYFERTLVFPQFCIGVRQIAFGSVNSNRFGKDSFSVVDRYLERGMESVWGKENILLLAKKIKIINCIDERNEKDVPLTDQPCTFSNTYPTAKSKEDIDLSQYGKENTVSIDQIRKWIDEMAQGNIPWSFKNQPKFEPTSFTGRQPAEGVRKFNVDSCPFPSAHIKLLPNRVMADGEEISFIVPFEYPLAVFFDHIDYFIKTAGHPHFQTVTPQKFYLFDSDWDVGVQIDKFSFALQDDPFERRIQKILQTKLSIYNKLRRVEELFWKKAATVTLDKVGNSQHAGTLQGEASASKGNMKNLEQCHSEYLANSCIFPDLLKSKPFLFKSYGRLCQNLFKIYQKAFLSANDNKIDEKTLNATLFQISAKKICANLLWSRTFTSGSMSMADILNAIESGDHYTADLIKRLDVFIGCVVDAAMQNITVSLSDYCAPLIYAPFIRVYGLLFMIEDEAYPESIVLMPITVHEVDRLSHKSGRKMASILNKSTKIQSNTDDSGQNFRFASKAGCRLNLFGVDPDGIVQVPRCVNPARIYHCLHAVTFGAEPTSVFFSPAWDGAFKLMDRCFDMFSKPSEERSPYLAIWDKLRLLICGTFSRITCLSPCRVICGTGPDLWTRDNYLQLDFSNGFDAGFDQNSIVFGFENVHGSINSRELIILYKHLTFSGKPYYNLDRTVGNDTNELISNSDGTKRFKFPIPLLHFPRTFIRFTPNFANIEGKSLQPHYDVRLVTNKHDESGGTMDSFRLFRIKDFSINVIFDIDSMACSSSKTNDNGYLSFDPTRALWINYYRDIEQFIQAHFLTMVQSPVRRGPLFINPFVGVNKKVNFSTILSEVHVKVLSKGAFGIRFLHFYDVQRYGGIQLVCGGSQVWLDWRKGTRKVSASNQSLLNSPVMFVPSDEKRKRTFWSFYFGEVSFTTVRIAVITNSPTDRFNGNTTKAGSTASSAATTTTSYKTFGIRKALPGFENIPGITMFEILSAPRLFYLAIDEVCFKDDPASFQIQYNSILARLHWMIDQLDGLTRDLNNCDPTVEMDRFQNIRQEIAVLLDQKEYIEGYLKGVEERANSASDKELSSHGSDKEPLDSLKDSKLAHSNDWIQRTASNSSNLASIHHFIIHHAQLVWHQSLRDAVFLLIDNQMRHQRIIKGVTSAAIRLINSISGSAVDEERTKEPFAKSDRERSQDSSAHGGVGDAARLFYEKLIQEHSEAFVANIESDDNDDGKSTTSDKSNGINWEAGKATGNGAINMEFCQPAGLRKFGVVIPQIIDVQFFGPQISLLGQDIDGGAAAIIVMAKHASMQYAPIHDKSTYNSNGVVQHCSSYASGSPSGLNLSMLVTKQDENVGNILNREETIGIVEPNESSKDQRAEQSASLEKHDEKTIKMEQENLAMAQSAQVAKDIANSQQVISEKTDGLGKSRIGRRTKVKLEEAQIFVTFKRSFGRAANVWPPFYPTKYLLTSQTESRHFSKISEKVNAFFIYDVSNPLYKRNESESATLAKELSSTQSLVLPKDNTNLNGSISSNEEKDSNLSSLGPYRDEQLNKIDGRIFRHFGIGDSIRVHAPNLTLLTTSLQYGVVHDVIANLLVYRDPNQVIMSEQLQSLVLASNVYDKNEIRALVEKLQWSTAKRLREVQYLMERILMAKKLKLQLLEEGVQKEALVKQVEKDVDILTTKVEKPRINIDQDDDDFEMIPGRGYSSNYLQNVALWEQKHRELYESYDELGIIVEAMRIVKAHSERLKQRQTRLSLQVELGQVQWSLVGSSTSGKTDVKASKSTEPSLIADFILKRIIETWISAEDGSTTNLTEIGSIVAMNRLMNPFYRTLIAPMEEEDQEKVTGGAGESEGVKINRPPINNSKNSRFGVLVSKGTTLANTIRFYWKSLEPIGGIMILEHVELNLKTLHIQLTYQIGEEIFKFFFPVVQGKQKCVDEEDYLEGNERGKDSSGMGEEGEGSIGDASSIGECSIRGGDRSSLSEFGGSPSLLTRQTSSSPISQPKASMMLKSTAELSRSESIDEMKEMKQRASSNCSFIYIKLPAMQHVISYKGRGERSITDIENFVLKIPEIEFHSMLCSWYELMMTLRKEAILAVVRNAGSLVKEKIRKFGQSNIPEASSCDDEARKSTSTVQILPVSTEISSIGSSGTTSKYNTNNRDDVRSLNMNDQENVKKEAEEAREKKARLLLGRSYQK